MDSYSYLILFFGRFHPLAVHLPVGFILFAFLLQVLAVIPKYHSYKPAVQLAWFCSAAGAIVAAVLGLCLSNEGGYAPDLLFWHQWLGIALAAVCTIAYLSHCGCFRFQSNQLKWLSSVSSMILLMFTGHLGGSLTHGSNYLFEYAPAPIQSFVGYSPPAKSAMTRVDDLSSLHIYNDIVAPIFADRCLSCHSEEKLKGGLDITSQAGIEKGGAFGAVIQPGNADESELIRRITLPPTDEAAMPPEGKARVSEERVQLLTWWVESGAPFDSTVTQNNLPAHIEKILANQYLSSLQPQTVQIEFALPDDIQAVLDRGYSVRQMATKQPLLDVEIDPLQQEIIDEDLNVLSRIQNQTAWLNLSNCKLNDALLQQLPPLPNLTHLNLSRNPIQDVSHISKESYPKLRILNLYQTQVDDDAIQHILAFNGLQKLYLWQTAISYDGVGNIQSGNPDLQVITGANNE